MTKFKVVTEGVSRCPSCGRYEVEEIPDYQILRKGQGVGWDVWAWLLSDVYGCPCNKENIIIEPLPEKPKFKKATHYCDHCRLLLKELKK